MFSRNTAKIGVKLLLVASFIGEAGAVYHHPEQSEHHQNEKEGERGLPPHGTRIERRTQEREREMERMVFSSGKQNQRNGGRDPEPTQQNEGETVRGNRGGRRTLRFEI